MREKASAGTALVEALDAAAVAMQPVEAKPTGLALLRVPFPAHQISKLPKPTKAQTDEIKANFKAGIRCDVCGAWHHPKVVHLDYVGHAALTDRLLDADLHWTWEPMGFTPEGLPLTDAGGGLWIKLTVCGVSRFGYGAADGKSGGDAIKELIGDALRNAAMRFGAALDLWHKGDLHAEEPADEVQPAAPKGYADWLLTFEAIAGDGLAAMREAYKQAPQAFREYLPTATIDTIKAKAAQADAARAK